MDLCGDKQQCKAAMLKAKVPTVPGSPDLVKDADIIGISLMSISLHRAVQVTLRLKKDFSIPILWGGIHPTMFPEESLMGDAVISTCAPPFSRACLHSFVCILPSSKSPVSFVAGAVS